MPFFALTKLNENKNVTNYLLFMIGLLPCKVWKLIRIKFKFIFAKNVFILKRVDTNINSHDTFRIKVYIFRQEKFEKIFQLFLNVIQNCEIFSNFGGVLRINEL